MMLPWNSFSILYILPAWTLSICYGFVLLSSAAGQHGNTQLFTPGESLIYKLHSTVLLNEKGGGSKNVGFFISGEVVVDTIWGSKNEKILRIELRSPKLNIKSRKAPSPDGFVSHTSLLKEISSKPFLVAWNGGKIEKIILPKGESMSFLNLKKGIASLFQFQLTDGEIQETDASGTCTVAYSSRHPHVVQKTKTNCFSAEDPYLENPSVVMGTIVKSIRTTTFELNSPHTYFTYIKSIDQHQMYVAANEDLGNQIDAEQILTFVESNTDAAKIVSASTAKEVIDNFNSQGNLYTQESLKTDREVIANDVVNPFFTTVNEVRDQLNASSMGGVTSAKSFVRLVTVARKSTKDDIQKALKAKKNAKIIHQLYDVLGYVQTAGSHDAVIKTLDFNEESQVDLLERYLWALSMATHPNPNIIEDLMNKYEGNSDIPAKVNETILLTASAMVHRLELLNKTEKISAKVKEVVLKGLNNSDGEERFAFLRAVKNLQCQTTLPTLLKIIKTGSLKEGVLAWKTIKSFNSSYWNKEVIKAAQNAYYQFDRKYDSSSRTISADILLESNLEDVALKRLIYHLASNETSYELKQYTLQKIKMLSEGNKQFRNRIWNIIKDDKNINNYSVLSPKGLSTAIKRSFLKSGSINGSLLSIQESSNNVVKRGIVNIVLDKDSHSEELFSLGIFTGGLGSIFASEGDEDDEEATAGMELTVLGTQIRPFVFFSGQGELMGHVWSGTASDRTTAFQALIMLQDHLEFLRLGSGFIVELDSKGAMSFDLAGKVEVSIWGRTAESLVEKLAGIFTVGTMKVDTFFVTSQVEFTSSLEPKLSLQSDIDFSANMKFCLRLTQQETLFRHNVFKIERIPGSKHKLRIAKYKKYTTPGLTYSLNKKNNEMCSAIFQ